MIFPFLFFFLKRNQAKKKKAFMLSLCFLLGSADKALGRRGHGLGWGPSCQLWVGVTVGPS